MTLKVNQIQPPARNLTAANRQRAVLAYPPAILTDGQAAVDANQPEKVSVDSIVKAAVGEIVVEMPAGYNVDFDTPGVGVRFSLHRANTAVNGILPEGFGADSDWWMREVTISNHGTGSEDAADIHQHIWNDDAEPSHWERHFFPVNGGWQWSPWRPVSAAPAPATLIPMPAAFITAAANTAAATIGADGGGPAIGIGGRIDSTRRAIAWQANAEVAGGGNTYAEITRERVGLRILRNGTYQITGTTEATGTIAAAPELLLVRHNPGGADTPLADAGAYAAARSVTDRPTANITLAATVEISGLGQNETAELRLVLKSDQQCALTTARFSVVALLTGLGEKGDKGDKGDPANVPAATTSRAGKVELATRAEVDAFTDATRAVTPDGLKTLATRVSVVEGVAAVGGEKLYMLGNNTNALYELNAGTGVATRVGNANQFGVTEYGPSGLAAHAGKLYMVGYSTDALYELNITTGTATRVGNATRFGVNESTPAGLTSHAGKLYMVGGTANALYELNPATGTAARVGNAYRFGVSEDSPAGLASHAGKLYMVGHRVDALYELNPSTGVATRVGSATAFGVNESSPFGLASHAGKLYMVGNIAKALYELNTQTGVAARVGSAYRFGVNEIGPSALASLPPPDPAFTALPDTPDAYTSAAGKFLRVNADANALEFAEASSVHIADNTLDLNAVRGNGVRFYFHHTGTASPTGTYPPGWDARVDWYLREIVVASANGDIDGHQTIWDEGGKYTRYLGRARGKWTAWQTARVRPATTSRAGMVELATNTEAATGSDATRAVTPANLSSVFNAHKAGISQAAAGSDNNKFLTPLGGKQLVTPVENRVSALENAGGTLKATPIATSFNLDTKRTAPVGRTLYENLATSGRVAGTYPPGWSAAIVLEETLWRLSTTHYNRLQIAYAHVPGDAEGTWYYSRSQDDYRGNGAWSEWTLIKSHEIAGLPARVSSLESRTPTSILRPTFRPLRVIGDIAGAHAIAFNALPNHPEYVPHSARSAAHEVPYALRMFISVGGVNVYESAFKSAAPPAAVAFTVSDANANAIKLDHTREGKLNVSIELHTGAVGSAKPAQAVYRETHEWEIVGNANIYAPRLSLIGEANVVYPAAWQAVATGITIPETTQFFYVDASGFAASNRLIVGDRWRGLTAIAAGNRYSRPQTAFYASYVEAYELNTRTTAFAARTSQNELLLSNDTSAHAETFNAAIRVYAFA